MTTERKLEEAARFAVQFMIVRDEDDPNWEVRQKLDDALEEIDRREYYKANPL